MEYMIIYCTDQGVHISCHTHISKIKKKNHFPLQTPTVLCKRTYFNCSVLMEGRSKISQDLKDMKEEHYHFLFSEGGEHLSKDEI